MPAPLPPLQSAADVFAQYSNKIAQEGDCLIWAGALSQGYAVINRRGHLLRIHRLLFEMAHGPLAPGIVVDHVCYRRDCIEVAHMRACSHKENMRHRAVLPSNNTSGARGVSFYKAAKKKKWEAHITVNDKKLHLGKFGTFEEAKAIVIAARAHYFGEFAGVA